MLSLSKQHGQQRAKDAVRVAAGWAATKEGESGSSHVLTVQGQVEEERRYEVDDGSTL